MKIVYLAAGYATLNIDNVVYNDYYINRDIVDDMLNVDLTPFDIIVASPPCNYWSRANYRRETSKYSQLTKHLLPDIISKLERIGKPFIVENVINKKLMKDIISNFKGYYKEHGRHAYFMSHDIDITHIQQINDDIQNKSKKQRQGGFNVNIVFEHYIKEVSQ